MEEIIALGLLSGSFFGIVIVVSRKIPVLLRMPLSQERKNREGVAQKVKENIQNLPVFRFFSSPELLLQKLLSKSRIFLLRLENILGKWLSAIRRSAQEKKAKFSGNYWEQLKKKK